MILTIILCIPMALLVLGLIEQWWRGVRAEEAERWAKYVERCEARGITPITR